MRGIVRAWWILAAGVGCAASPSPPPPSAPAGAPPSSLGPSASAISPATSAAAEPQAPAAGAGAPEGAILFIENDYARALAEARARGLPLFVDAWAPWCHTCLSLRSYVFPDPALRPWASRFVWLSLDTERDDNAAVVGRLGVTVLPTLYVIDPASEKPVVAWPGSLTAPELADLLSDAASAVAHGDAGGEAAAALLRGHQASASGKLDDAVAAYRAALAAAPPGWPRRPQAVDALVTRLSDDKQPAACVSVASEEAPRMPPGTPLADVLRAAMSCADDLPTTAPERQHLPELAALGERVAGDMTQPILADDRSDLYNYVVGALKDLGRKDDVLRVAQAWSAFLDDRAHDAPTPQARVVFDAHRLLAYLALGHPERAVPMLQASEHDFPDDYNPPARLATAYLAMKRPDDALAAVGQALGLAYGPRKLRLWALEADVYEAKGDKAGARKALTEALTFAKGATLTGGYPKLQAALEKRLARLR
jgi:thioredoxin-like negative regulator of GroEL